MSLITEAHFKLDINIATSEYSDLPDYIAKYEPKILEQVLGYELGKEVQTYDPDTSDQRIIDLVEGVEFTLTYNEVARLVKWVGFANADDNMIANYVWYWYQRSMMAFDSGIGQVQPKGENVRRGDASSKAMAAWDAMFRQSQILYLFLDKNNETYPEWYGESIGQINCFDL